ncbi:Golgi resident protein GCP60-like isoform X2 [Paramacrobiotus metropolitanus]|uniref:Golgi resident protein GCP60-like isoform X2 n=1 Tax=Paramacrobiotus metropolitanus TaxID=2943436 RepID=UPI0024459FEE|nr:Golgi resident protein GCP60-like isoform X2 [Paramacrobiotus metropolitanus]
MQEISVSVAHLRHREICPIDTQKIDDPVQLRNDERLSNELGCLDGGLYTQVISCGLRCLYSHILRRAWSSLGEMSKEEAMLRFVDLLDLLCPLFKPYIEAHKRDREDLEKKQLGNGTESIGPEEGDSSRDDERSVSGMTSAAPQFHLTPEHEQEIRNALNAQTLQQFKAFCEQQLPGKVEEQKVLIAKLQEEHFRQYVRHWMEYQVNNPEPVQNGEAYNNADEQDSKRGDVASDEENEEVMTSHAPTIGGVIQTASVWTRKDLKEFKDSVKKEGGEGILKIGQGETVTIRVPTHPEGNYLFWEFATDSYDLGFGLYFEWSNNTNDNRVTIHVSETDEDDEDIDGEGAPSSPNDPEKGGPNGGQTGPPVDEILPVYRRDCHEEVIAGSHLYPARQGVYLLKFDNSFSLWRSKTLYYRVYYTR